MTIDELLDKAKTRSNLPSDYALAKAMGIERQIISQWRKGRRHPSNEEAVQLATLAGLEEMQVIAQIEYETAKNEHKKEFWKHFIESRGLTAIFAMSALACTIAITPETAEASVLHLGNYGEKGTVTPANQVEYTLCEYKGLTRIMLKAIMCKLRESIMFNRHIFTPYATYQAR